MSVTKYPFLRQIDAYKMLKEQVNYPAILDDETKQLLNDFLDAEIAKVSRRMSMQAANYAESKAEQQYLRRDVYEALTDEWQSIADIVEKLNYPEATKGRVTYWVTDLVKSGEADRYSYRGPNQEKRTKFRLRQK